MTLPNVRVTSVCVCVRSTGTRSVEARVGRGVSLCFCFLTESGCVALGDLSQLPSQRSSCLCIQSAGTEGVCHHYQPAFSVTVSLKLTQRGLACCSTTLQTLSVWVHTAMLGSDGQLGFKLRPPCLSALAWTPSPNKAVAQGKCSRPAVGHGRG